MRSFRQETEDPLPETEGMREASEKEVPRENRGYTNAAECEVIMEYKFTSGNFEKEVLESDVPVLVDFYADWCGPCKMMAPVVEQLAGALEGRVRVGKLNIDENMDIAGKYRVMNIPTFLIFKNGQEQERIVGAVSQNELRKKIEQTLV